MAGQMRESASTSREHTNAVGQESSVKPTIRWRKDDVHSLAVSWSTSRTGLTEFLIVTAALVWLVGIEHTPVNAPALNPDGPRLTKRAFYQKALAIATEKNPKCKIGPRHVEGASAGQAP